MNKMMKPATAIAALLLMTTTAFAQGPIGNCGNQDGSGGNPFGQGNTCGNGDNGDNGSMPDPVTFDMTGSAFFGGGVFGDNQTGAVGDVTIAGSNLKKFEAGGATVVLQNGQPPLASAFATVGVQGGGFAGALSAGPGSSQAATGVLGQIQGVVGAGVALTND